MCSCLVLHYLWCFFVYYLVVYLRHVRVLTLGPCDFLKSVCLLLHAVMIHVAAHSEIDVLFTPCAPCVTCCQISSTSWMLLCVGGVCWLWCVHTYTHRHTSTCSGCHKQALGSLVPPRKWSQKADEAKQWPFILMEKTSIVSLKHTRCTVKGT